MTTREQNAETSDPDYEVDRLGEINESLEREDARDLTVQRIKGIIQEQFSFEIELKEKEVLSINRRIHDTRRQLDRIRACILAGYYGYGKCWQSPESLHDEPLGKTTTRKTRTKEACLNEILKWKQSLPSHLKEEPMETTQDSTGQTGINHGQSRAPIANGDSTFQGNATKLPVPSSSLDLLSSSDVVLKSESRFYVKRRVIVGNTSKYILPEHREKNDRSTHKWMVYVRGPKDDSDLESFIGKVWFLLHPSYQPNDLVEVCKPPFQVTRRGWGEFPVRVQLHFTENRNKRVDIIHHLKLDKTYTGLQTLGAETHVDIELDRKNFDSQNAAQCGLNIEQLAKGNQKRTESSISDVRKPVLFSQLDQHLFNDHSYSAKKPELTPLDEELKYPTPPTSIPGSRCSSPTKEVLCSTITYDDEVILRTSIQKFPIIDPNYSPSRAPYCATLLDHYFGWTIGKRLAAEWQRGLAIKKHLATNHPGIMLSTKEIMNYCRFHGYSPVGPPLTIDGPLCKVCGEEKAMTSENNSDSTCEQCDVDIPGSLSCGKQLLNSVEQSLSSADNEDEGNYMDDSEIDVVSVHQKELNENSVGSKLLFLPMTEELEWVQETASAIDIHLQGMNIDGVRTPLTTAMLHKACSLFVADILRKANRFTWKSPLSIPKAKCILPVHVKKAVDTIPHCDFLTDKYLGVVKPSKEGQG